MRSRLLFPVLKMGWHERSERRTVDIPKRRNEYAANDSYGSRFAGTAR